MLFRSPFIIIYCAATVVCAVQTAKPICVWKSAQVRICRICTRERRRKIVYFTFSLLIQRQRLRNSVDDLMDWMSEFVAFGNRWGDGKHMMAMLSPTITNANNKCAIIFNSY